MVNGQKGFRDNDPCATCAEEKGAKKCARCHYDSYCNKECQQLHWFVHKKYCKEKELEYQLEQTKIAEAEAKEKENASQAATETAPSEPEPSPEPTPVSA